MGVEVWSCLLVQQRFTHLNHYEKQHASNIVLRNTWVLVFAPKALNMVISSFVRWFEQLWCGYRGAGVVACCTLQCHALPLQPKAAWLYLCFAEDMQAVLLAGGHSRCYLLLLSNSRPAHVQCAWWLWGEEVLGSSCKHLHRCKKQRDFKRRLGEHMGACFCFKSLKCGSQQFCKMA
jgi:hypothetical protein